ncbi:MAG TPA: precorrin-8X methylmutase [Anaeromyxobacteraceae bacterium]|nr:precorrin-8X methylmutase [Anaeromyxobacteraceae bacterium]
MTSQVPAGRAIEAESFRIIEAELPDHGFAAAPWRVVRRMVHATADLDFARNAVAAAGAVEAGAGALARGAPIVCDVRMIAAGLSSERLGRLGVTVHCLLSDPEVAARAREAGITRSAEAMRLAHRRGLLDGAVVAIGNAPTALFEVIRLVREEGARPALVVGVPVGFVGAAESKEAALALPVPHVVVRGRKGGTPAAVAALHALLDLAAEERR